jgi:hypothetical protein
MRKTKWFASVALAAGMMVAGTSAASAQDWRDVRHDNNRVESLRNTVARDRARLAEDLRYGNRRQVARDREILDRHESELRLAMRDTRWDNRGGFGNGYNDSRNNGGYNNSYNNGYRR